ncbi:MAG TPA: hypothetical protein VF546_08100 [Pyrinomonadaceae bacterium]|jgi:hypothetical protein
MKIAKIIGSNSHVDYLARVIDQLDVTEPPRPDDYGFAQFVALPLADDAEVVGVIFDTALVNPDYGQLGPRLSPPAELSVLSPDVLHEQGVLVRLLLVGGREGGRAWQGVPRRVLPVGQDVYALSDEGVRAFHRDERGRLQLHYYSQAMAHAGPFAVPLLEAVITQLEGACAPDERQRLCVLRQTLVWQRTVGGARL